MIYLCKFGENPSTGSKDIPLTCVCKTKSRYAAGFTCSCESLLGQYDKTKRDLILQTPVILNSFMVSHVFVVNPNEPISRNPFILIYA